MKNKLIQIFNFLIYLIAGGICGYFGFRLFDTSDNNIFAIFWVICSFYVAMLIQVIIHECGHLIFGVISGYKFLSIRFFNLTLIKKRQSYTFQII